MFGSWQRQKEQELMYLNIYQKGGRAMCPVALFNEIILSIGKKLGANVNLSYFFAILYTLFQSLVGISSR